MIKFIKPQNLNGTELLKELEAADIKVQGWPSDDGAGNLYLDISKENEVKAAEIVASHNGTMIASSQV
jgi:hypothetical protein